MEQLPSAAIAAMAAKARRVRERPPFDRIALLLQGGGALGSYQAGVFWCSKTCYKSPVVRFN